MAKRGHDSGKVRFWREAIRRQRQSGLTIRGFCASESISEASFHWWRRELASRKVVPLDGRVRARRMKQRTARQIPPFVPVTVTPSDACPGIEITLVGGTMIRVHAGAESQLLREVLSALEPRRC